MLACAAAPVLPLPTPTNRKGTLPFLLFLFFFFFWLVFVASATTTTRGQADRPTLPAVPVHPSFAPGLHRKKSPSPGLFLLAQPSTLARN